MRFFDWLDFQYEILAVFTGLISLIMVYAAWAGYPKRRRAMTPEEPDERGGHETQPAHDAEKNPVPPFLIYTYVIIAIWSVSYMIFHWARSSIF